MHITEIKAAYHAKKHVAPKHLAKAIAEDAEMLFTYMIDNNPAEINKILRVELGHDYLPFVPDRVKIGAVIHALLEKQDKNALNVIARKYVYNPSAGNYTTKQELLTELKPLLERHV